MDIKKFTAKINALPTLSSVANQINAETQKESLTAKSLSVIISKDPALTSKILQLANSAYYGLVKQVTTVDRAVTVLGLNTIKSLALSISVYKYFKDDQSEVFDMKGLWYHSLGCAVAAKVLASVANAKLEEQAFVAGILHDIGKIAIAKYLPKEMSRILTLLKDTQSEQSEIEMDVLGFTHQRIGGVLAESWNFPEKYVVATKYHHGPIPKKVDEDKEHAIIVRTVFVGNQIAKAMKYGKSTDQLPAKIPLDIWQFLGIHRKELPDLRNRMNEDYEKICESWNLEE